jgi:hypothetical protein
MMLMKNTTAMKSSLRDHESEPMIIYLADPVHNFISSRDNWMIALSVLNIGSYIKEIWGNKIELRIFKFPEPL